MTNTNTRIDLHAEMVDALAGAGFLPVCDLSAIPDPDGPDVPGWVVHYRWDAARVHPDRSLALCRWSEDGIDYQITTHNGVIRSEVRLNWSATSVELLAGLVEVVPA